MDFDEKATQNADNRRRPRSSSKGAQTGVRVTATGDELAGSGRGTPVEANRPAGQP